MVGPAIFFTVVTIALLLVHFYVWRRLVRATTRPGTTARRVGTTALSVLAVLTPATLVASRSGVDLGAESWPGFFWMSLLLYLVIALVALEVPRAVMAVGRRVRRPESSPAPDAEDPGRRLFIARSFAVTAGVFATAMSAYGAHVAFNGLRTTREVVAIRGLDPALRGLRIAVVGDLHLGPLLRRGFCEEVVERINAAEPDLVAVVGDLVDGTVGHLQAAVEPLREITARHGAYYVLGDHEYAFGPEEWIEQLRDLGLRPLQNERLEIGEGAASLDLAGVNDPFARMYDADGPDIEAALADRDDSRPLLLLAHDPVQLPDAVDHDVDLLLAGHTHGGQTAPLGRVAGRQYPVAAGLGRSEGTWVYVTRGAGFWGPPARAGVAPEVSVIELDAGPAARSHGERAAIDSRHGGRPQ